MNDSNDLCQSFLPHHQIFTFLLRADKTRGKRKERDSLPAFSYAFYEFHGQKSGHFWIASAQGKEMIWVTQRYKRKQYRRAERALDAFPAPRQDWIHMMRRPERGEKERERIFVHVAFLCRWGQHWTGAQKGRHVWPFEREAWVPKLRTVFSLVAPAKNQMRTDEIRRFFPFARTALWQVCKIPKQ